ncbi:nicotinamide mononucleotide adenylyltransferase [Pedobacter ginsengisoli]|uniref:Nicotinamide mononucleotide adenylyltransferase n=1 Tax=Pedobacter ginsengisoli TaxID=363852 RepID=A0A2D1U5L7_9SPHI|nr:nicotinamide mononucleotide adenylyltransferase [Pedobacter ginsengisoli]ATP56824.1 nicotinamide mononucleotide adenylyltransferase [Pedobacter ginsengisoli]
MEREILDTKRKALKINLNPKIYGTFAEIGAGQEVARNFFTAGAASGTVAKTMSAYDMTFSDAIYGVEESGRYVSKSRLLKMLNHEFGLLTERLSGEKYDDRTFFAFADTVTTLNYNKSNDPHGWIGLCFQSEPGGEPNEIFFHVRLLDTDAALQQNVLGIIGVNLVYAAFYYNQDRKAMIESLADNLTVGSVEIDLISVNGPVFKDADNILLNLYLIVKDFSDAAIFDAQGQPCLPKDLLYKKDIMILRTKYAQKSHPNFSMLNKAVDQFVKTENVKDDNLSVLIEVLMSNLLSTADDLHEIDLRAVAKRAEEMCKTGNKVIVSNFSRHNKLAKYLDRCRPKSVGISTNINNLKFVFNSNNFGENYSSLLLSYVSDMFSKNVKLFAYPFLDKKTNEVVTSVNMPVTPDAKPLFDFLILNGYITDIQDYSDDDVKTV